MGKVKEANRLAKSNFKFSPLKEPTDGKRMRRSMRVKVSEKENLMEEELGESGELDSDSEAPLPEKQFVVPEKRHGAADGKRKRGRPRKVVKNESISTEEKHKKIQTGEAAGKQAKAPEKGGSKADEWLGEEAIEESGDAKGQTEAREAPESRKRRAETGKDGKRGGSQGAKRGRKVRGVGGVCLRQAVSTPGQVAQASGGDVGTAIELTDDENRSPAGAAGHMPPGITSPSGPTARAPHGGSSGRTGNRSPLGTLTLDESLRKATGDGARLAAEGRTVSIELYEKLERRYTALQHEMSTLREGKIGEVEEVFDFQRQKVEELVQAAEEKVEFHKAEAERLKALVNSVNLEEVVERGREMENENALLTRALVEESQLAERRHKGVAEVVEAAARKYKFERDDARKQLQNLREQGREQGWAGAGGGGVGGGVSAPALTPPSPELQLSLPPPDAGEESPEDPSLPAGSSKPTPDSALLISSATPSSSGVPRGSISAPAGATVVPPGDEQTPGTAPPLCVPSGALPAVTKSSSRGSDDPTPGAVAEAKEGHHLSSGGGKAEAEGQGGVGGGEGLPGGMEAGAEGGLSADFDLMDCGGKGPEDASNESAMTPRKAGKARVEEWQEEVGRMPGVTSSVVLPADDKCPPLLEYTHQPSGFRFRLGAPPATDGAEEDGGGGEDLESDFFYTTVELGGLEAKAKEYMRDKEEVVFPHASLPRLMGHLKLLIG